MKLRVIMVGILFMMAFCLTGCVAMIKGSEQKVAFKSEPEGALFTYYNRQCKAPCEMVLPRTTRHSMIHVERDGFPPYSTDIAPDVEKNAGYFPIQLLELILLPIGIVDMALCLGSGYQYDFPSEFIATYKTEMMAPKVEVKW